ncbi:hypothetical protein C7444_12818 [Sphaerotilus hippei]|uniref:DAPG hydrolase PhiG domain-containing protein n=1 Tax=Sphaerotilus hippei TaxID=744406 RepID=A0A318H5L4_9BURK|nr:hypothetical protein [Sphaerotilus hippei]PXW91971.1 hypothetical protein C7444_12818 [Sphaerotilus hippei]
MRYQLTSADRAPIPASYDIEARYLGYRTEDHAKPYAKYFQKCALPIQAHAREAMITGPVAAEYGIRLSNAADMLARPGYLPQETGYTLNSDGHIVVSVLTKMPGVTGEMWDWWFGWHGAETARYKLWHPDAHVYTGMGEDRSQIPGLSDRQKYINNVSYVDEYLGASFSPLTVRFVDPQSVGFAPSKPGNTVIVARGGLTPLPLSFAWLIHQVRATPDGSEMRSRFFANCVEVLNLPSRSTHSATGKIMTLPVVNGLANTILSSKNFVKLREFGPDMMFHCAQEMNHLASFLPELYAEFK